MPNRLRRILIADSHDVMRGVVRAVIEERPNWIVCGEAATARDALAAAARLHPDVVLLDSALPGADSLALVARLREASAGAKILILSVRESLELARQFHRAGADAYLQKSEIGHTLLDHISMVLGVHTGAVAAASDSMRRHLTTREREVLRLLAQSKTNRQVAEGLQISVKTVETHRARIMNKLDLHSIGALVRYAIRNRLIDA